MERRRLSALMNKARAAGRQRPTVMIVDDDSGVRKGLELALGGQYELVLCDSAEQALQKLSKEITAVILDIKMRGRDGFWFCEQLEGDLRFIPIIFHSGHHGTRHMRSIINDYHPFGYLRKGRDNHLLSGLLALAVDFARFVGPRAMA